jgi:hypothetical protein
MDGGVIELERLVLKDRKIRARDAKTMPRSRRRGEQKEVPLPRPSGMLRMVGMIRMIRFLKMEMMATMKVMMERTFTITDERTD